MCKDCSPLLHAIEAYIAKADNDLADELEEEGYAEPKSTIRHIEGLEDDVAEALVDETNYFVRQAEKAVDLDAFAAEVWPKVKLTDGLRAKLTTVFAERLSEFMPEFIGYYLAQTDRDLRLAQVSKRTTAWVESWSQDLAGIMQLNSHKEIETILKRGLQEGHSMAEFTRAIQESGIRDEYLKARRVAVTEVLTAHRAAHQEAAMQSPVVKYKRWRHTGSYRNQARANHVAMDGKAVRKEEPFVLNGADGGTYYPMYPGETILPAGERINCHCLSQDIVDEDILGLSLEERQQLQQQAVDRMDADWEKELDARNRAKAGIKQNPYHVSVAHEYTGRAKPGTGTIAYEDGLDKAKKVHETKTAKLLHDTFGGDITLLLEASAKGVHGVHTPDYLWGGRYWELKGPGTISAVDHATRKGIEQIQDNPGGLILDLKGLSGSKDIKKVKETVLKRLCQKSKIDQLDVILLTDGKLADISRYKK